MDPAGIAKVTFTSVDRVRDVIHNFDARRDQKTACPAGRHELPFSTWSLSKLADFLVAEGVVEDISHEGLRTILREQGVSFPGRQDEEDQH